MKTSKQLADEVWRRVEIAKREKAAKQRKIYSLVAVCVCLAFVTGLAVSLPHISPDAAASGVNPSQAVMFAEKSAGGYVLVAVVAFALGAAAALFCVKMRDKDK